jgi:hypothetical protein
MFGPRDGHSGFVHRDNCAVGVGHQAIEARGGVARGVDSRRSGRVESSVSRSMGGKVFGPSGGHSRLIHRDNCAVGVGHQAVEARGGVARGVAYRRSGRVESSVSRSVSGQMFGPSSSYCGLVSWDNGAVRMGHQGGEVQGAGIRRNKSWIDSSR